jgi:hypothetical protein
MHCLHRVVPVRFTDEEWDLLDRLAAARQVTIEELIREDLRLAPLDARASRRSRRSRSHLRLVRSDLFGGLAEDA